MFIANSQKGSWQLDLAITSENPWIKGEGAPKPTDKGSIVHLVHSMLIKPGNPIQTLQIVVISLDLVNHERWGPYTIGAWSIQTDHDLTDTVHHRAYCSKVLGIKLDDLIDDKEKERIWEDNQRTEFMRSMVYSEYSEAEKQLNRMRAERTMKRSCKPRESRDQKFDDDNLDVALARIISRIDGIMNTYLFWGIDEGNKDVRFNPRPTAATCF